MPETEEDIVLTDEEIAQLESETWRILKTDPDGARKILRGAGWLRDGDVLPSV